METVEVSGRPPKNENKTVLVIGKLDGVHLGHQYLLHEAKKTVRSGEQLAVYSFSDHPKWVLKGEEEYNYTLTSSQHKREILDRFGVYRYYHVQFTEEYARTSPETFVFEHLSQMNLSRIVVGEDFRFGKGRGSDAEGLAELCRQIDIPVTILPVVKLNGEKISSTTIRTLVQQGHMEAAQAMLSRPFELTGIVEKGEQLGRELGFPTLNLGQIEEYVEVKPAVYLGVVELDETPEHYYTLISAGYRPTVNGDSYKVEAYLLDYSGDLYNHKVRIKFLRHLRDEVDFNGIEALVEQMKEDERKARLILGID
ncbi:riboflavin biosynthesis protein RibF [Halobacillus mangrovi]|uniref:Riboflavin biosynthesis protein n=1 Tax=Halobacillus mangrovi TaxID=402384 RepID=A0A1W6A0J2_9BACI|nr:riboflavin biosynthesis protein RibF [Halobacillus mangrovi]ARI79030.1 riboflavin biosynthesis protein RibF [Halobacillus mangrovi]